MYKIQLLISYFLLAPVMIFAGYNANEKSRMIADLDIIKNEIQITYAPADWKKKYLNWDLDREIKRARDKILSANKLTARQYQQIIRDFFNSVQDMHVGVDFYSTEFAVLPFLVQGVNNRYFVVWVDEKEKEDYGLPLQIGDEILSFDDKPVAEIIRQIQSSAFGSCDSESYRRLSELQLTLREGNALQNVPQGIVEIAYKKNNGENSDSFLAEWQYVPEEIDNDFLLPSFFNNLPHWGNILSFINAARFLYTIVG